MRITQLSLEGRGVWPGFRLSELSHELNLFYAGPRGGKSTLAQLVAHLLYGKTDSVWRRQFGQALPPAEGSVTLRRQSRTYVLRRRSEHHNASRLTIASTDGAAVDQQTVQTMLGGLSPGMASQLYAVDFAESPRAEWLFSKPFGQEFTARLHSKLPTKQSESTLDRRRIDELVRQRNSIARQLEDQIRVGRRESAVLEEESKQLDLALTNKRQQAEQLRSRLRDAEKRLAELTVHMRHQLVEATAVPGNSDEARGHEPQLRELDGEIMRCRQGLSDLQARSVNLRTELAKLSPDGSADRVTCLTDSRNTLGVVERLLGDLDAEVAQLARAEPPTRPTDPDAHTRLSPLVDLLHGQVYALCGQLSEQERHVRRQQLLTESRQLHRSQSDLGERLEQLLEQREAIIQQAESARRPVLQSPHAPVVDHCRCENHQQYIVSLEDACNRSNEAEAQEERSTLERERLRLLNELADLGREIAQLETKWKQLQQQRSGLIGGRTLEANRSELDRLQSLLEDALRVRADDPSNIPRQKWRASDVLAQLTAGRFVQIRLTRDERLAMVVDRAGRILALEELNPAQHDQLYLALTLALVSSYADRKIRLPLVLDEPFLRQDAAGTTIMAEVLEEFARAGHQLLLFTEDREARRTLESLSCRVIELEDSHQSEEVRNLSTPLRTTHQVCETCDGQQTLDLRLASGHGDGDLEAVFYLSTTSSLDEFPVLGSNTSATFARLGIHAVGDLLTANPSDLAKKLKRSDIRPETIALWQSHMKLLCRVPELTLNDAQLLTACGVSSPEELRNARTDWLWSAVSSFLDSDQAQRYQARRQRYTRKRIENWIDATGGAQDRESSRKSQPRRGDKRSTTQRPRRFHLQRDSDVEAAPSIGPKTAARLAKVGIRTVADLLNADPDSTAEELGASHIRASTIEKWQQQARLVCQIPELYGYGAQLLVASGFTEPEQIAECKVDQLAAHVLEFCKTKQGQRILRSAEAPSAKRIGRWIEHAQHRRPLEVA